MTQEVIFCANPSCQHHIAIPGQDDVSLRLAVEPNGFHSRRVLERHEYQRGAKRFFLCDDCNSAVQFVAHPGV